MVNYIGSSFCLLPQYCQIFLSHCLYIISYMCMTDNITVVPTCTIVYYTCSLHCGCKLLASTFFSIVLFRYCFYSSQHYCYMTERYRYMYTCRLLKSLKNSGVCLFLEFFLQFLKILWPLFDKILFQIAPTKLVHYKHKRSIQHSLQYKDFIYK